MGGGQDKPAWTACPPGVKITRAGGKISRDSLPPRGASQPRLACPPGGKLSRGQDKLGHRNCFSFKIKAVINVTEAQNSIAQFLPLVNEKEKDIYAYGGKTP